MEAEPAPIGAEPSTSADCASCHAAEHQAWRGSHHALAQIPVAPDDPALGHGGTVRLSGPSGVEERAPTWAIGVDPLRQYVVPGEGGRWQVTQVAWDPARAEWFDVFADGRQPGEWGHWTGRGMTWNAMCAACHTTGLAQGYDPVADTFATTWTELGVGCAACHGDHTAGDGVDAVPADTCASCHARAASLTGAFAPGEAFLDHYLPALPDETDTWHATGGVRDELFEAVAFRGSRMHAAGVRCVDCHEPHTGALRREGDALCHGCHPPAAVAGHDRHDGAVACVDCHMPVTTYMQRHDRRDHGLRIPDPALAAEVGAPSACDRCHDDVGDAAARWWPGLAHRPHRARARAIAAARAGDGPGPQLAALDGADGHWRGVILGLLGPWSHDPAVKQALSAGAASADPWVRLGAARALSPADGLLLRRLLRDEVRAVRIQAALGLRHRLRPDDPAAADLRSWLDRDLHQPVARATLAEWHAAHGALDEAEALLRQAIAWDPVSRPLRSALATTLSRAGRPAEARAVLEEAVAQAPADAELRFQLALARAGEGDHAGAAAALEAAVARDPEHARAWYNLGLVRDRAGDAAGAVAALERADALAPQPPDALWALATIVARTDPPRAITLARQVLARDPAHPDAQAWLSRVDRR